MIDNDRSARAILVLWAPLALQWLMMAAEGPFLAAVIARLVDPTYNLAAYGVAFTLAILVESPVIMLMSAATALVDDGASYRKLRNFTHALNAGSTALLLIVLIPPVYDLLIGRLLGLPAPVTELVYGALWLLLPWPAAIGYRRFLHGILIRSGRTRRIALGTVIRLAAMAAAAIVLSRSALPGAWIGAAALSAGVLVEAVAAGIMSAPTVRNLLAGHALMPERKRTARPPVDPAATAPALQPVAGGARIVALGAAVRDDVAAQLAGPEQIRDTLSYAGIGRFYLPLALTSLIGLAVHPLLTFFMGRAPAPVESLALFPVVHGLTFLFRAFGLSYQEAAIALLGRECEHAPTLARFAAMLALATSGALALVAFTPLADVWFGIVSGLPPALAALAVVPTRIVVLLPALTVLFSFQSAILVQRRTTRAITLATAIEVLLIATLFPIFAWGIGMMGVTAAMLAFLGGRTGAVLFLARRTLPVLMRRSGT